LFLYGWFFGFGYFFSSLYWISISLTFDDNFKFLIPLSISVIPAFLAIFYGFAISILKYFINKKKLISSIFLFSLSLGIFEFVRGKILSGFPWNLIAYSFSEQIEFIQINSVVGVYGFNLFCLTLFSAPALFILRQSKKEILVLFFILLTGISNLIYGYLNIDSKTNINIKKNINIVSVSTDVSLERFYSNKVDEYSIIIDLINLSDVKRFSGKKTFFVWPEGVLPSTNLDNIKFYQELFEQNFDDNHFILIGLNREETNNGKKLFYNSLALIDRSANLLSYYDKIKLVPFGEFLPLENLLSKLGLKSLTNNYQSYSKGENKKSLLNVGNIDLNLLVTICYEIIYSGELNSKSDYDLIINVSEDGWFGNSIGPHQHFAHSIFRSIENGRTVIRSANNGISAIIEPNGKIKSKIDLDDTGSIFTNEFYTRDTIFSNYGNKTFILLILIYIFFIFSFIKTENE
tara:strand:- start:402 stop:1784 length:1383 start_codon:yes stop_codon:yes gene_type:complete